MLYLIAGAQLFQAPTVNSDALGQYAQVFLGGHRDGDRPPPVGVAAQADVLHQGVGLELRLHLAQGHVLAELRQGPNSMHL